MTELNDIDKYGDYFHLELLKYYYNFLKFYKQKENLTTDYLHFEFEEQTYSILYSLLQDKAYNESLLLKERLSIPKPNDTKNGYQI